MKESFYENGKREGLETTWYENGEIRSKVIFKNGIAQ